MRNIGCGLMVVVFGAVTPRSWSQQPFIFPDQPLSGVGNDGTNLLINIDGDVALETFPIPPDLDNAQSQFFLTPSRQRLYAVKTLSVPPPLGSPCTIAHSVRVFLYRIVPDPNPVNDFGTLSVVHDGVCLGEIARLGFFDRVDGAQRIAFIAQDAGVDLATQEVMWINLNAVNQSTFKTYTSTIGSIQFAPTGMVGFVQRDLTSGQADGDYTFVCLHPDALGNQLAIFDVLAGPAARATLELDQNGDEVAHIHHDEIPAPQSFVSLQGCGPPEPETGPCCRQPTGCIADQTAYECTNWMGNWLGPDDTCSDCPLPPPEGACCLIEGYCNNPVTSTNCDGNSGAVWHGVDSDCSECPQIDLTVTKSGPAEVDVGDPIVYTLRYENDGPDVADNTVLSDAFYYPEAIPSDGGEFDKSLGFGTIRWDIGTLFARESGEVSVEIPTDCFTPSPVTAYPAASIKADYARITLGGDLIETIVRPLPSTPLEAAASSVASNGLPLISGDIITHTIWLTNTINEPRQGVHFSIRLRRSVERFLQTLDDGGGVIDTQGGGFTWTGDLAANETVSIIFTIQIRDCLDGKNIDASLNRGEMIEVLDFCDSPFSTIVPQTPMPVQHTLSASVSAINLDPPSELATFLSSEIVQAARDGDSVVVQIEVTNHLATPRPLEVEFYVPFGLTVDNDPPFVAPTDVPATYDAPTERVFWSGTIDPTTTIRITMEATISLASDPVCSVFVQPTIDSGDCFDISQDVAIHILPPVPTEGRVIGVTPLGGDLWGYAPGIDDEFEFLTCTEEEFSSDVAMTSDGDIWVTGAPFYRINLVTGDFEGFPHDFHGTLDLDLGSISHAAGDPTNNSIIFLGAKTSGNPIETVLAYRRYDALTGTVTPLPELPVGYVLDMIVDTAGRLVVAGGVDTGVGRIDFSSPGNVQPMMDEPTIVIFELALDADGDYMAIGYDNATRKTVLVEIRGGSGGSTVRDYDLDGRFGGWQTDDLTVAPNGDIYISDIWGGLAVISSSSGDEILIEQNFSGYAVAMDYMVFLDPSALTQPADCDANGRVDLTDWAHLQGCLTGPIPGALPPGCSCADVNGNDTADLRDLFAAQAVFAGSR